LCFLAGVHMDDDDQAIADQAAEPDDVPDIDVPDQPEGEDEE